MKLQQNSANAIFSCSRLEPKAPSVRLQNALYREWTLVLRIPQAKKNTRHAKNKHTRHTKNKHTRHAKHKHTRHAKQNFPMHANTTTPTHTKHQIHRPA